MKTGKIIYFGAIAILLLIFLGSAIYVGSYFYEGHKQQSEYDDLASIVESIQAGTRPTEADTPQPTETTPDGEVVPGILPEYEALHKMNGHMVGWIKIEDTQVNYPVMQSPEQKDFYIDHNFNKEKSARGCIYVREECDVFAPSDNLTIYGHHMVDGSMFENLRYYERMSYWEDHDRIIFDTLYEHHTYRIFAVFKTTAALGEGFPYHKFIDAANEAEFDEFIATCKELSFYDTGITPKYGDKIICLSTCEYSQPHGRFVVVGMRID